MDKYKDDKIALFTSHKSKKNRVQKFKGDWNNLPNLLLENIFAYLSAKEKYNASMTCRSWYSAFHLPYSWHTFVFDDTTLTRRKFNYYSGWQFMLDHLRVQICLQSIGSYNKVLVFRPTSNFYNLYEFMNMISFYVENGYSIGSRIRAFHYTFPCNMATSHDELVLYGTGGKLLEALKRLMGNLSSLQRLELIDLMLENYDAQLLLDQICFHCCATLKTLVMINTTKQMCQLLHPGVFVNLQVLVLSPQNLGSDLLLLISQTTVHNLYIVQNAYTPTEIESINVYDWKRSTIASPQLKVHLRIESLRERQILWQIGAPVSSIIYKSPIIQMTADIINKIVELYSNSLLTFGNLDLPKFYQPKSFIERNDRNLIDLCRMCNKLDTLIVREKISTCTLLLLAYYGQSLKYLYVRRNAVILRFDWQYQSEWSSEFYQWLKKSSMSYQVAEEQVAKCLGLNYWSLLNDKEFKSITLKMCYFNYK